MLTEHKRNVVIECAKFEERVEACRIAQEQTFPDLMGCSQIQASVDQKLPPPTPDGREGRLFPPEQL